MTVNVVRRRSKAAPAGGAESSAALAEIGETLFACPACGRPLAIGVRRCPGCSARLVMGVRAGRAAMFVTIGLIIGVAFGGGLAAAISAVRTPARDAQIAQAAAAAALAAASARAQPAASGAVGSRPAATSTAAANPTVPTTAVPPIAAAALTQALVLDARLDATASALRVALAATRFDTQAVSQLLRDASATSVVGLQVSQDLSAWSGGSAVGGRLTTLYTALQSTAADGLAASIRNDAAYRRAARAMVTVLAGLGPIDAEARQLAAGAGISRPGASPTP